MFMLRHGFLQLGDLGLLLLNDAAQVFDAVVVRQLVFGHLQPAGSGRASESVKGGRVALFVRLQRAFSRKTNTGDGLNQLPVTEQWR